MPAYDDLRGFISALEQARELKRIPFEVDPHLEIAEFADRSAKNGGPAFLFEKPKGSAMPVLINAFASTRRMEMALGVDSVEDIAERISGYLDTSMNSAYRAHAGKSCISRQRALATPKRGGEGVGSERQTGRFGAHCNAPGTGFAGGRQKSTSLPGREFIRCNSNRLSFCFRRKRVSRQPPR